MPHKYESLAVFAYPFDPDGGGTVRYKSEVIASGVTDFAWAGGELRVATRDGAKRVRLSDDGSVAVEDVGPEVGLAVSRGELTVAGQHIHDFFDTAEPEPTSDVGRDVAAYLSRTGND